MQIKLTETNNSWNSAQCYSPSFRNMSIDEIEKEQQSNLKSYAEVGYNSFLFNRSLATIFIRKIDIKSIEDIFNSDIYGLLKYNNHHHTSSSIGQ